MRESATILYMIMKAIIVYLTTQYTQLVLTAWVNTKTEVQPNHLKESHPRIS